MRNSRKRGTLPRAAPQKRLNRDGPNLSRFDACGALGSSGFRLFDPMPRESRSAAYIGTCLDYLLFVWVWGKADVGGEPALMETRVGPKVGYLLPTRERVMQGNPAAVPLLQLAERAESLGFDSIWIGDSLIDRPRHEPLVMLAGVAGRTKRVSLGTGVLLPALRDPVQLAHQVRTPDQISE